MCTPEMDETVQLAKTFSTACKNAVAEGKTETNKTPVLAVALVALTAGASTLLGWL